MIKDFLKSASILDSEIISLSQILSWIKGQNDLVRVEVQQTALDSLKGWKLSDGRIVHESGKFFSIDGISVKTNYGNITEWDQPIINQPEIGYLGFVTKKINGVLYFLIQAKIEPGNINHVQLSPTLQATKSNFSRVHQGKSPNYLDLFVSASKEEILIDQLQSEQGARFLKKRNRNIIIKTKKDIDLLENFLWVTLGQIKALMRYDNIVNMDTRTVISSIPLGIENPSSDFSAGLSDHGKAYLKSYQKNEALHEFNDIISKITALKCKYELEVDRIAINNIKNWRYNGVEIAHEENKYFKVIGADISIQNREVVNWSQPLIMPAQEGICAFVGKRINGVMHFIVQAKLECGNFDIIELAPTVQCLTGNFTNKEALINVPFLEYILQVDKSKIIIDAMQSEEGGRFFREQNRNMVIISQDDEFLDELPDRYIWMTLRQIQDFIRFNNYINIQARGLIASLNLV